MASYSGKKSFTIKAENASGGNVTWNFGDGMEVSGSLSEYRQIKRRYCRPGTFNITCEAGGKIAEESITIRDGGIPHIQGVSFNDFPNFYIYNKDNRLYIVTVDNTDEMDKNITVKCIQEGFIGDSSKRLSINLKWGDIVPDFAPFLNMSYKELIPVSVIPCSDSNKFQLLVGVSHGVNEIPSMYIACIEVTANQNWTGFTKIHKGFIKNNNGDYLLTSRYSDIVLCCNYTYIRSYNYLIMTNNPLDFYGELYDSGLLLKIDENFAHTETYSTGYDYIDSGESLHSDGKFYSIYNKDNYILFDECSNEDNHECYINGVKQNGIYTDVAVYDTLLQQGNTFFVFDMNQVFSGDVYVYNLTTNSKEFFEVVSPVNLTECMLTSVLTGTYSYYLQYGDEIIVASIKSSNYEQSVFGISFNNLTKKINVRIIDVTQFGYIQNENSMQIERIYHFGGSLCSTQTSVDLSTMIASSSVYIPYEVN